MAGVGWCILLEARGGRNGKRHGSGWEEEKEEGEEREGEEQEEANEDR